MGGLSIFLILSLTSHLLASHRTLKNVLNHKKIKEINEIIKSHNPREYPQKIGKFRQSVIGPTTSVYSFKFKG